MKFLLSVITFLMAGSAFAQQPGQCMQWKYRCVEKDEFGTCVSWETECIKWSPSAPEGPGKEYPGTGEGRTMMLRKTVPQIPAEGHIPPFILDSMSQGVDSFEVHEVNGKIRIVNIVRTPGGPR